MMRIGYIQMNPRFGDKAFNIEKVRRLSEKVIADLLVLPELFNTGYTFISRKEAEALAEEIPDGETTRALNDIARRMRAHIVAGLCEREGNRIYNSSVLVGPEGFIGRYRKIHLFKEEKEWFEPGNTAPYVWDIGNARVGIMICLDYMFPEVARTLALKGADIICHPSNLVLPYCQAAMVTRSLENGVFTITANRTGKEERPGKCTTFTGKSQIVGPRGDILVSSGQDTEELRILEIEVSRARDKKFTEKNDLFADRRPDMYQL